MLDPAQAWPIVQDAILAFQAKVPDMAHARHALVEVLRTGAWARYVSPTGRNVNHDDFAQWVAAPVPTGLHTSVANLWEIARGDRELSRALQAVGLPQLGEPHTERGDDGRYAPPEDGDGNRADNIRPVNYGTGETYTVRRLKRDRPDLAAKVISGEMSANAAAIEAGFRPRTATVRVDDPESTARTLRSKMAPARLRELRDLLSEEIANDR